jgi:hypothetical protein
VREQADYLIEPPMPDIGLRDWKRFDLAIRQGYETAQAAIERDGVPGPPAHATAIGNGQADAVGGAA